MSFATVSPVSAGPMVRELTRTDLADFSEAPFDLNTDRYKGAFATITDYLKSHAELPADSILMADNHGHFLNGVISQWTYYTYGTHKGIDLYVFNPEDGGQFLTVEIWVPKEQQWNLQKKQSYLSSLRRITDFLSGPNKYRLDLVFQDDVPVQWGKGYEFKLDDENTCLLFNVMNGARPEVKSRRVEDVAGAATSPTPTSTANVSANPVKKAGHKTKKSSKASASRSVAATPTVSEAK